MDLASHSLRHVVSEPILQQRGVQGRRAQAVEAETLTGVHDSQLARQGQDGSLGRGIRQLRGRRADEGDDGRGVYDAALGLVVAP